MDETERRLLTGIYAQLSLMNRQNEATFRDARTIDEYVAPHLPPAVRGLLASPAQPYTHSPDGR